MIGYVTLGTNDFPRATAFYDALMVGLGKVRIMEGEGFVAWGTDLRHPGLCVTIPYDRQAATAGNGTMVALALRSQEEVDAFHTRALALGGSDEGAPGERRGGFYAAYVRDLDGNKLCAFCMLQ
ncbi:MAG TPA: VOC family protein [Arenimonas sp.]|nr:VOC family protein [Arenimonas sp.]